MNVHTRRVAIAAGIMLAFGQIAAAQTPALRVFASNGVRDVMESLKPQCERAVGRPLEMRYGTSTSLVEAISKGERFDVAVLTSGGIDDLIKSGKLVRGSRTDIARAGIGVGVRAGAAKPDIATPDAFKQTLLKAKSITYAEDGASRVYLEKMFSGLGIDKVLKPKIVLVQGSVKAGERVASGSVELILTLVSEILPMPGVDFVGPLPAQLQSYVSFAAAVSANAASADAGKALIKFLTGSETTPAFKPKGMERVR